MPGAADQTLEPMVRKLGYWAMLDADDRAAILALPNQLRTVEQRQDIVRDGEKPSFSCVMLSGFSFRYKLVAGGARQILSIHMKGDLVDLQNSLLGTADHSVEALVQSQIALIPQEAILELALQRPRVGFAMWYDTLVDGSIFREWIANIGRRNARTSMAHLLCEIALKMKVAGLGEQTDYELPLTQEQLADALGLTPVHVNRTIKLLDEEQLISRATSRSIIIGDWKKLAEAGDFDSGYLHLKEDEPALA